MRLNEHLSRIPARGRRLVLEYARPRLIDWQLPVSDMATVQKEQQFEMITEIKSQVGYQWITVGSVPFSRSGLLDWQAIIQDSCVYLGITRFDHTWMSGETTNATCVEVVCSGPPGTTGYMYTVRERTVTGSFVREFDLVGAYSLMPFPERIYLPGTRFHFAVDLASNILTVSFRRHVIRAIIPELATYRPFCYFSYLDTCSRPTVSFC